MSKNYRRALACMFVLMRLLDKIYEGKDTWGRETSWWDMND